MVPRRSLRGLLTMGNYHERQHVTGDREHGSGVAQFESFFKAYKLLCLVLMYSALWTTICVVLVNRHILPNYVRQTAYTNHCVQAGEGTICRDARLSGSPQDVNPTTPTLKTETITITPTPKRIPQRWLGPKGYVTHDNKRSIKKTCGTCAIVNSAGRLIGSKAGQDIDEADCVIRMNGAPTATYEADVGTKTTYRVIGHRNFPKMMKTMKERRHYLDDEATRSDLVVVWHYGVNWKKNSPARWSKVFCSIFKKATVYLASETAMKRNEEMFYGELDIQKSKVKIWMSTGWGTMLFALDVCETIDVYGMIYEDFCSEHPNDTYSYHYFDKARTECSYYVSSERQTQKGHKFLTEKAIFAKWAAMYGIVFHEPSWDGHLKNSGNDTVVDTLFKRTFRDYEEQRESNSTKS
ncbi:alpha-N-acetyl-neuraminyl-2,3-beta-galactosyl-1,3-N-acetyl-galactosaminide alpha-2,6-sialyltransferase-like isoform X1 [Asterias amurensis]|uniref:alpha-N-acetyl-neuraminyl-2,3-beta-galactosyl-1, 3-N-acetyl-galactosaminide alpha-2,6-sialyltransferase-like isoform X1 n=1 Tax=Asterias amurensis TaxID=7602 RepID=UPI003AB60D46